MAASRTSLVRLRARVTRSGRIYPFFRSNPKGEHAERWCHSFGCGQWFNVSRNTVTHEVLATYAMGEPSA